MSRSKNWVFFFAVFVILGLGNSAYSQNDEPCHTIPPESSSEKLSNFYSPNSYPYFKSYSALLSFLKVGWNLLTSCFQILISMISTFLI